MRFMILVKASAASEAGIFPPDDALMAELAGHHQALQEAGVLPDGNGLQPSAQGSRIHCGTDGTRRVVDGPLFERGDDRTAPAARVRPRRPVNPPQ